MGPPLPWPPHNCPPYYTRSTTALVLNLSTNIEGWTHHGLLTGYFPLFFCCWRSQTPPEEGRATIQASVSVWKGETGTNTLIYVTHTHTNTNTNRPERIESPPGSVSTWSRRIQWGHVIRHCRSRNIPPAGRGQKQNNSTRIETFAQVADVQHMLTTCHFPDLKASVTFHGSHHFEWCLFLFSLFFHLWKKI